MVRKSLIIILSMTILQSCGAINNSKYQQNLEKLDKIYGKCDNPHRQYRDIEKEICYAKERAAGPDGVVDDPINLSEVFDELSGKVSKNVVYTNDTNSFLWDASLNILNSYSLKISDYDGGYIETDWIRNINTPNQRCLIKTHVLSKELVSNGVKVKIVCEKLSNDEWFSVDQKFINEEKKLILTILEQAQILSQTSQT